MYSIALTPATCFLSNIVFQIWCHALTKNVPLWLPTILISLSNDIHSNPGPHFQNNFFNFMSWNLNSLSKDNLYRSPSFNHTTLKFQAFLSNFKKLHSQTQGENPFATFFTGDFNAHSQSWWPDGDTNPEGIEIENLFTLLGLSQIISEPTNFEPNKSLSCIDLIATDQPNLILDCGTRASLDTYCHHQII